MIHNMKEKRDQTRQWDGGIKLNKVKIKRTDIGLIYFIVSL